jgi:ankyrin repeat protein
MFKSKRPPVSQPSISNNSKTLSKAQSADPRAMNKLETLPLELIIEILLWANDFKVAARLALVCTRFRAIANEANYYPRLFVQQSITADLNHSLRDQSIQGVSHLYRHTLLPITVAQRKNEKTITSGDHEIMEVSPFHAALIKKLELLALRLFRSLPVPERAAAVKYQAKEHGRDLAPLHLAADLGNIELFREMLDSLDTPETRLPEIIKTDSMKSSVLFYAVWLHKKDNQIAWLLLDHIPVPTLGQIAIKPTEHGFTLLEVLSGAMSRASFSDDDVNLFMRVLVSIPIDERHQYFLRKKKVEIEPTSESDSEPELAPEQEQEEAESEENRLRPPSNLSRLLAQMSKLQAKSKHRDWHEEKRDLGLLMVHDAVRKNRLSLANAILAAVLPEKRIDIILEVDVAGRNLLSYAVGTGQVWLFKALLALLQDEQRATVIANLFTLPTTPIHYAVRSGSIEMVHHVLEQIPDVAERNAVFWQRDDKGNNGLDISVAAADVAMAKYLLNCLDTDDVRREKITEPNREGRTPLQSAARLKEDKLLKFLLSYFSIEQRAVILTQPDKNGHILLHDAFTSECRPMFCAVMRMTAPPQPIAALTAPYMQGCYILPSLIANEEFELADEVLERIPAEARANAILQKDANGYSAFDHVLCFGDAVLLEKLLTRIPEERQQTEVWVCQDQNRLLLFHALRSKNVEFLDLVLHKIKVEEHKKKFFQQQTHYRSTVLSFAARKKFFDNSGRDIIDDTYFTTPAENKQWFLQIFARIPIESRFDLLVASAHEQDTCLHFAADFGATEFCQQVFDLVEGSDLIKLLSLRDKGGKTIMQRAIDASQKEFARMLLAHLAPQSRHRYLLPLYQAGFSYLHYLLREGKVDAFLSLLSLIEPEQQENELLRVDKDTQNILFYAAQTVEVNSPLISITIKMDEIKKADFFKKLMSSIPERVQLQLIVQASSKGVTPLDVALIESNQDAIHHFIEVLRRENRCDILANPVMDGNTRLHLAARPRRSTFGIFRVDSAYFNEVFNAIPEQQRLATVLRTNDQGEHLLHLLAQWGQGDIFEQVYSMIPEPQGMAVIQQATKAGHNCAQLAKSVNNHDALSIIRLLKLRSTLHEVPQGEAAKGLQMM